MTNEELAQKIADLTEQVKELKKQIEEMQLSNIRGLERAFWQNRSDQLRNRRDIPRKHVRSVVRSENCR